MLPLIATWCLAAAPGASVEVLFTGDVIPHDTVKEAAKAHERDAADGTSINHDGWDHVFGPLTESFRRSDVAVVNLETPLTVRRKRYGEMVFWAPPALAQALKAVGVTVATFANNHARDQHTEGITETRRHLDAAGLATVGAARTQKTAYEPLCFEKNGMKICFMAFTRFLNRLHNPLNPKKPHVPIVDYDLDHSTNGITERQWLRKVKATAQKCDALFITPHWGEEYFLEPLESDRKLAWAMIDAGAVAVIGNHPHVLQAVETYARSDGREGLIAYSLGNLVSAQGDDDMDTRRDGLLLSLTVAETERGVTVRRAHAVPVWTENRPGKTGKPSIQPVVADEEISAMRERVRLLEGRSDAVSRSEMTLLGKRLAKAIARRERILDIVPIEMYEADQPPEVATRGQ